MRQNGCKWIMVVAGLAIFIVAAAPEPGTPPHTSDIGADLNPNTRAFLANEGVDFSRFEMDQIPLYYFTDVTRLVQILNPAAQEIGGIEAAQQKAVDARKALTTAELNLSDAQASVNKLQERVLELQEEVRKQEADLKVSSQNLNVANRNLASTQAKKKAADQDVADWQKKHDADPTNPLVKDQLDRALRRQEEFGQQVNDAQTRQQEAQQSRDAAQKQLDDSKTEQNGLPAQLTQAKNDLELAQENVAARRKDTLLAAQAESEAFALARDNPPFWFAPATPDSKDPVKRVQLIAFSDRKTIFVRGTPVDVKAVKSIIAVFDRPTPQARLTLWTLQLNTETNRNGSRRFNQALAITEDEVATTRAEMAATISILRDTINEEVNRVASNSLKRDMEPTSDNLRLARYHFYQYEVLLRLEFDPGAGDSKGVAQLTRLTIPDPAATTTLGESLMVLALGNRNSQKNVMENFRKRIEVSFADLPKDPAPFESVARALGIDFAPDTDGGHYFLVDTHDGITPIQLEIVRALQRVALPNLVAHLGDLAKRFNAAKPGTERDNIADEMLPILNWMWQEMGITPALSIPAALKVQSEAAVAGPGGPGGAKKRVESPDVSAGVRALEAESTLLYPTSATNARVAAADEMLKQLIIAAEDDIDALFVRPMTIRLRDRLVRESGVNVGVIERTSVLASNRLVARVDPRASAQLAVGQEQNVLQAAQQLAQIYLAAETGGFSATLGALNGLPAEKAPELYGITSGAVFQVTPIIDPSGQALKFTFDYTEATQIREPDGTTNPQLPRIERHTVNTEVQLSNLEIREISRFESNVKLGIPTRTTGGIPILNDVPLLRDIPLIGWFTKKSGHAAVTQESLVFGQTTIYPTIGDITDLFNNAEPETAAEAPKANSTGGGG